MRKILVIVSSELLKMYLKEKLENLGFEVILAKDGFDGLIKIKNILPDLVIMELQLTRLSALDVLREKKEYKTISEIPVILIANKITKLLIEEISKYKVNKIIGKPLKVDILIQAISDTLKIKLDIDITPCIIDVHLNDDILFVEIASGLNRDKFELLKYHIKEILELHNIAYPKILIILSDIEFSDETGILLTILLKIIEDATQSPLDYIKILTTNSFIKEFLSLHERYKKVEVINDFTDAIDKLGKLDVFAYGEEIDKIKTEIITNVNEEKPNEDIELKFSNEVVLVKENERNNEIKSNEIIDRKFVISIIDDDLYILEFMATLLEQTGWAIPYTYDNGKAFLNDIKKNPPDLIIIDLLMPEMNGIDLIQRLKNAGIETPILIISAVLDRENIFRARRFGVTNYITKPLKANQIISKVAEILKIRIDF
ncbi:MAG TPA: response regulator [Spirochaetota bacterium]|nr:response regulator [Spirochaetota bacterium]HOL57630.1 response regulator [Spirochaetota bacterium]HPP05157.1 response regulator [Spirochaetota bacterium]